MPREVTDARRNPDGRNQRGSALMLFPAAVLIVIFLASLAVDSSVLFLGQRELANAAEAAANDAAAAVDQDIYFGNGSYDVQSAELQRLAAEAIAARLDDSVQLTAVSVVREGPGVVRVELRGNVDLIFAKAVPGIATRRSVHASATAQARRR